MCTVPLLILLKENCGTKCPVVGVILILFFKPWLFFLLKAFKFTRPPPAVLFEILKSYPFPNLLFGKIYFQFF